MPAAKRDFKQRLPNLAGMYEVTFKEKGKRLPRRMVARYFGMSHSYGVHYFRLYPINNDTLMITPEEMIQARALPDKVKPSKPVPVHSS